MSALAHILISDGVKVSGSDGSDSKTISRLVNAGADIKIGHAAENIKNPDLVVYTAAISDDNPELVEARARGIETLERADFLGEIMKQYEMPVAVSGTHGKTTTTAMLSCVLLQADYNPTILVGGEFSQINGNYHIGTDKHLVFEACEYVDSFLKFNPFAAIVLNVEADHLDYFSGLEQIKKSFNAFMKKIPRNGFVVLNSDDENVMDSAEGITCKKILYGSKGEYKASGISFSKRGTAEFDVEFGGEKTKVKLSVRGIHNVSNALAVFAAAHNLGAEPSVIAKGLESFTGTLRRFEYKGEVRGASVYDDYAHHPTEITATIQAASNMPHNNIWCVFQPHTYSRTRALLDDFAVSLSSADRVIVTDIYAAREKNDGMTHATSLSQKIKDAQYMSDFNDIADYIKSHAAKDDIVILMGAGTVTDISRLLV